MTNSEIARKITQKGIPEGMTLGQAFTWVIELEAGYQLSEGVSLARPPEIMQVQEVEAVDEIAAMQRMLRDVVCWGCGDRGHLQRDCPHRTADMQDDGFNDSNAYAGKSEQVIRITQPIMVATRDNIYKHMVTQRTRANLYKVGYRRRRGGGSPQMVQVKQEPAPPGNVATPKASSTVVRRGKGRGQKTSTVSVVEAMPEENEYFVEVGEEDLEGSDSDPTELYEILAEIAGPEEEIEEGLEPEIEPPI